MILPKITARRYQSTLIASILGLAPLPIWAAGYALIEQSVSGQGNAFAGGSAIAEDATTIYFNPAGMTRLSSMEVVMAGNLIRPVAEFHDHGSTTRSGSELQGNADTTDTLGLVPNFYYMTTLPNDMKFGLGINAPFGLVTEYDQDWVGRYHAIRSALTTININPALAWKATDQLSIGLGVSLQYAEAKLSNAIDFGSLCMAAFPPAICTDRGLVPQDADGLVDIQGDNWDYGFNLGLLFEMNADTRLGLHYRSQVEQTVEGEAEFILPAQAALFTSSGRFQDTGITSTVTLPETVSASFYHRFTDSPLAIMGDVTWTRWSRFNELRIQFDNPVQPDSVQPENWEDSTRYALGLNYHLNPTVTLRSGIAYDEEPIPNTEAMTPRLPGNDRLWLSVGASYHYSKLIQLDVGYSHILIADAAIHAADTATGHLLLGEYTFDLDILSAQFNFRF